MTSIHLAFKAFDVHELLCHFLAESEGLYANAKLSVTLLDWTFIPDGELPANTFQAACGAALGAFLRGERRKVVYVARPHIFSRRCWQTLESTQTPCPAVTILHGWVCWLMVTWTPH
jgi:hypothetical protein